MRPQWKSWLARGAVLLIGFAIVLTFWWLFEIGAFLNDYSSPVRAVFLWVGLPFALGVAIYTAFLFAQAEGRDLWQSALLPFHLVAQAFMTGSALLLLVNLFAPMPTDLSRGVFIAFVAALLTDLFVTLAGEFGVPHASEVAARAAHNISHGRYKNHFWGGSITLGHIVPIVLLLLAIPMSTLLPALAAGAGLCAIIGLYLYEYVFVMAPQEIQNS
jgi:formate-dependent nitrite reductase membrane component NrfD